MDNFHAISVSHKRSDLNLIGKLVPQFCANAELFNKHLQTIKKHFNFNEFFLLNTCNRILCIYVAEQPISNVNEFFAVLNPDFKTIENLENKVDDYHGNDVVKHLFTVCSGLDSMVVGEHEILGQVKKAYQNCRGVNVIGDNIRILFEYAIANAKKIYHQTDIGRHTISVVALAVQKLRTLPNTENKKVVILGAGETIQKTVRFLIKMGFQNVTICNRTLEKAQQLSKHFANGKAMSLSDFKDADDGFDVLITCLDKQGGFINETNYKRLLRGNKERKIAIDLAIPNNVSKVVVDVNNLDYTDIESLRDLAAANYEKRKLSLTDAEALISEQLEEFSLIHKKRKLERALSDIPQQMKQIRAHAIQTVFQKDMDNADDETKALVEKMLAYVEKKYISIPMTIARDALMQELGEKGSGLK